MDFTPDSACTEAACFRYCLNNKTLKLFNYHWLRLSKQLIFFSSEKNIKHQWYARFWCALVKEIFTSSLYTISQVCEKTRVGYLFIYALYEDFPHTISMHFSVGEQLLLLHAQARPDLQPATQKTSVRR